ncbi:MAG: peptidoglycan editing factor PgeF [Hydrogenophilus sp.]
MSGYNENMDELPLLTVTALRPYGVTIRLTTRTGGVSAGGYHALNLADHVGDDTAAVAENRARLRATLGSDPLWLKQVHGTTIWDADAANPSGHAPPQADGATTARAGRWLALLTADCLPVVLVRSDGARLAVAHAGWRGLAAGILARAVAALGDAPFAAWIGPAICGQCYEVDAPVVEALRALGPWVAQAVRNGRRAGHYTVDLGAIAAEQLKRLGAQSVIPSGLCTWENGLWYSHRRDGPQTGRFATLAALQPQPEYP